MEFANNEPRAESVTQYPLAVCPSCNTIQKEPILDNRIRTINITCPNCNEKFCSYCGGDRHIVMSCRKPLPKKSVFNGDQRV